MSVCFAAVSGAHLRHVRFPFLLLLPADKYTLITGEFGKCGINSFRPLDFSQPPRPSVSIVHLPIIDWGGDFHSVDFYGATVVFDFDEIFPRQFESNRHLERWRRPFDSGPEMK